ncbi:hypothetical protein [Aeromicrobium sp. UC242_57]|uniref:hypothetical protein n=1 Tax=Aeromicrobium sp. UC242_57 TaxID=3374624 RepID=UPI0037B01A4C
MAKRVTSQSNATGLTHTSSLSGGNGNTRQAIVATMNPPSTVMTEIWPHSATQMTVSQASTGSCNDR